LFVASLLALSSLSSSTAIPPTSIPNPSSTISPNKREKYTLTPLDTLKVFAYNTMSLLGLGDILGMSQVPTAEIQKYEGSFLSFIKGALGE